MNIHAATQQMITTLELLEEIKKNQGIESKYALAKNLGCSKPSIDRWLNGNVISDRLALRGADLADLDPGYVLYSIAAERAQKEGHERLFNFWKEQADKIPPRFLCLTPCILWVLQGFSPLI